MEGSVRTLIVVHGNRYIEVFSSERHPVKIVNVPDMRSAAGELLIEELLDLRLPAFWANVYRDGNLADRELIRDLHPTDIVSRDNDIALIRTMNGIIKENLEVQTCKAS